MSKDFHFVFVLSCSVKFSIFWVSNAQDQKAPCMISNRTSSSILCPLYFVQSITLSGLILLEEKSLGVLIF